jgi:hypothetical protein
MAVCDICGKCLRSATAEAMAAHQLESSTCFPPPSLAHAPPAIKQAEAALRAVVEEGERLRVCGSFDEVQRNAQARADAHQALKRAKLDAKADKRAIKDLAQSSMSAASWTQALKDGSDSKFARAEGSVIESRLAAETVGLVTSTEFRQKREELAAEEAQRRAEEEGKREREQAEAQERKRAKKRKHEERERRGLSFEEQDGE